LAEKATSAVDIVSLIRSPYFFEFIVHSLKIKKPISTTDGIVTWEKATHPFINGIGLVF
jgi:hypothetical protein